MPSIGLSGHNLPPEGNVAASLGSGRVEEPVPDVPRLVSGSVKAIGSQWPLSSRSRVSPTIGSPRSFSSLIRSPASRTPRHWTNPAFQSSSDISSAGGLKNEMSLTSEPRIARPRKNLRRWKTGWLLDRE